MATNPPPDSDLFATVGFVHAATRLEAYERQHGVCPLCGGLFELSQMEADHIMPWRAGGRTVPDNCQMPCRDCNRRKGAK